MIVAIGLGIAATPAPALAAASFIYRGLTLPRHDVALDFGLGLGHVPTGPDSSRTGFGFDFELAVGLTHDFELGLRTGFRLDDGGQVTKADSYGRPFETETYGTNFDRVANPELRLRWSVARGPAAELGLELRFFLPTETGSRFGLMFGLPVALRAGMLRVDTGVFVPIIFTQPDTTTIVSVPFHLWFQVSRDLWVGALLGLKVISAGGSHTAYPLGFGLGNALSRAIDLKLWFLFPDMNQDSASRYWGAGVGLQARFE